MQFLELQKVSDLDLDLDLGSGQLGHSHITMHNTCRTTSMLDHVTVASCNRPTEMWPFDFREISTFGED